MKKSKKKIIIVGKNPPPYHGTSVWFETLQQASWDEALDVKFFNNNLHTSLDSLAKFSLKKLLRNLTLYRSFARFLREEQADLVLIPVSQTTMGFLKDAFFVRIATKNTKTLLMLHGSDWKNWLQNATIFVRGFVRKTLKKTVGVVVLGEKLRYLFESNYKTENIYVVPNGIDVSLPMQQLENQNDDGVCELIYLGNLQKSKGILHLLEVLTLLKSRTYRLTIIGSWVQDETQEQAKKIIEKHQLPVAFLGPKYGEEKFQALSRADVFVFLPQSPEGLPLSILEAMAMGLPILAADQGAISECVRDGENGFLVSSKNTQQAADKLDQLISNSALRKLFAENSLNRYQEHFTAQKMIANFTELFKNV